MTLPQASFLPPTGAIDKQNLLHSQKRLQSMTKAAVDRACKLSMESRRLVHIVDTQSCGSSKGLGLSNPLSSLSSALMKRSSSASPRPSRQWALSRGSNDRRRVAARIHSLLIEWKADSSFEWRARVAFAVPILEEALYKEAKSKEEYRNPQLLESQLLHVLCHFEAGNGPFLLQGSTPLYPVRASSLLNLAGVRKPPFDQNTLSHGSSSAEICELALEQVCGSARVSCAVSSSSGSPASCAEVNSGIHEAVSLGSMDSADANLGNRGGSRLMHKVVTMIAKKRRENSVSLKQELGKVKLGFPGAEDVAENREGRLHVGNVALLPGHASSCSREERRRRRTLGGMLQLNTANETTSQVFPCIDAAEASPTIPRNDSEIMTAETGKTSDENLIVDVPDPHFAADSGSSEEDISTLLVSDDECSNASAVIGIALESGKSNQPRTHQEHGAYCGLSSNHSLSPSSASLFAPSSSSSYMPPFLTLVSPSSSHVSSLRAPSQTPDPCRSEFSPQLSAPSSTSLKMASKEPQHSQLQVAEEPNNCATLNGLLQSVSAGTGPRTRLESQQSTIRIPSQPQCPATDSGTSSDSSPSASTEESSRSRERGVKLTLRRFLAEREEYKGCTSRSADGGCPWETWEEATEQLDGTCCVCMVGLKGAAFVPCGHTFCRKCSRELWRGRGTCPLCNRYIREILDIY